MVYYRQLEIDTVDIHYLVAASKIVDNEISHTYSKRSKAYNRDKIRINLEPETDKDYV